MGNRHRLGALQRTAIRAKQLIWRSPRANKAIFLFQNGKTRLWRPRTHGRTELCAGSADTRYQISVMVRVKNEEHFIAEWIAHYLAIGVDHFYVYDNASTDQTQSVLQPLIEAGIVTYLYWDVHPITPSAELDFFERYAHESAWVAFFDSDEFLEITTDRTLAEILSSHDAPAVSVNWRLYGSAWQETVPADSLLRALSRCDRDPVRTIKVIARPREVLALRNPHNFYYKKGRFARTVEGVRAYGTFADVMPNLELELRHYVFRGSADHERKLRNSHAATAGHQLRGRAEHTFASHNDIDRPFRTSHLDRVEFMLARCRDADVSRRTEGGS